jgi:signal transduction histidine kinase/ActR/RegA family two-component response regulator
VVNSSLGRKVLVASLAILLLLSGLYVLVAGELKAWADASAYVMRDYRRAMLDGELHRALTRAVGEAASYVLTGNDGYRAEAAEALEQANAAAATLRQIGGQERLADDDDSHVRYLAQQERLLRLTQDALAQVTASPTAALEAEADPLRPIYAYETDTDTLWREIAAHHGEELQENMQTLQDHSRRAHLLFLTGVATFAIAAGLLIGYVQRRVVAPLAQLARLTRSVAAGDLRRQAEVTHRDEIGQLQRSFNQMVVDLEQQRLQLTALIESLASSRDAAEEASRAKSDFLANVSHEIRTPMNGVLIGLDLLHETAPNPEQRDLAEMMRTSARHLLGMLNDLLDFSRIEAGRLYLESVGFALRSLVTQMVELHGRRAAAKGVTMSCRIADDVPARLCGDPARLGQVLLNLLDNAIKFTDRGSIDVSVSVDAAASEPAASQQAALESPIQLRLCVTDSGVGIPAEAAQKIFQPFYQAQSTRNYEGIGLGLGIAHQLARMMGGTLGFESEVGRGSTFWFTARLLPEAQYGKAAGPEARPQLSTGKAVLLVEDHRETREVLARILRRRGLKVSTAENGRVALAMATREKFDLILMDCRMREMDGFEATRAIRALGGERAEVPIIALTAYGLIDPKQRYLDAGFDDLVVKPYTLEEIEAMLRRWLERGRQGQPVV